MRTVIRRPSDAPVHTTGRRGLWTIFIGVVVCGALLLNQGCSAVGPDKLLSTHDGYNDAVQLTVTREVLKNIVRLRYYDPMQFLRVSSVNAQFSVSAGSSTGLSGLGADAGTGQLGANVGYSESPTITFVPQSDANFNKSLDSLVDLQEALAYVFQWGSVQPYELGMVIASINDASDRSGKAGLRYRDRINAIVSLAERGASLRNFRELYPRHVPLEISKLDGLSYALAAQADFYFYDAGDGKVNLASKHLGIALLVPNPNDPQTVADLTTLGLVPGEPVYPMRTPGESEPETFFDEAKTIWIATRSPESMMELASMTVEVPAEHAASGIAPPKGPAINSSVELPMKIKSSLVEPDSLYRVQHRGYWYYIDDRDPLSKRVFSSIVSTYNSRIGLKTTEDEIPQMVLPVTGG